jgi:hypothetical protein
MCGLLTYMISGGAPAADELAHHLTAEMPRVLDLAVELAVRKQARRRPRRTARSIRGCEHMRVRQRPQVSCVRSRTLRPRSSTIGR